MCGICGYLGVHEEGLLEDMTAALSHRGPDDDGYFRLDDVGLGHRRLSIIDVAGGHQPIANEDETVFIICNGEIFNYRPLRERLLDHGHRFRTQSDTEVILHLYEEKGPQCVQDLNGQFAFAIFDRKRDQLFLARDRLGIKPLYYVQLPGSFLFASEFKSLLRYPGLQPTLNPAAIDAYLRLRYVPGPGGMFQELRKLPAAHYAIASRERLIIERYWEPRLETNPPARSEEAFLEEFSTQFERSVQRRLMSEVPLGAYLSGGIDSSIIVAAFSRLTPHPVHTFSVGFDYQHDELTNAARVAELLGCEHTEILCRPTDIELLPDLVYHLDEPIGDAIIIPMYRLAEEAKRQVSVVLTGEGADELLGGYLFHRAILTGHRLARLLPAFARRSLLPKAVSLTPSGLLNLAFDYPANLGERGKQKVLDYLALLEPSQLEQAYIHLISLFDDRDTRDLYAEDFRASLNGYDHHTFDLEASNPDAPQLNRLIHLQFTHWLPDDILMKQDKMSMAHALEARVPFLDHELVEYMLTLPPQMKIRGRQNKYILRRYAQHLLPEDVFNQPKRPFYIPLEEYFTHPTFQAIMHDTLSPQAIRARGIFNPQKIRHLTQSMDRGEFVYVKQVFSLIFLELWFRMAVDRGGKP